MIKLLLIFLLPLALNAAKILSYNIYDRTDRADVMLTFDTPYDGAISQSSSKNKIIIKLKESSIESAKFKKLSSKYLYSLSITPMSGYTQIVASVPSSVKLKASKTSDAYGLRLRFFQSSATKTKPSASQGSSLLSNLPTKKDTDMSQSYYIVVAILIIGILILFFIRKKVTPKDAKSKDSSWLFKENQATQANESVPVQATSNENVSIRFQKNINDVNSVVMLDFGEQSYLVLMGSNNILLDKFLENKPQTQKDFETILQDRHKELDEFLKVESTNSDFQKPKEAIDAYKERAASISYEV